MIRVPAEAALALAGCLLAATSCDQPTDDDRTPDPPSTSSPDGGQILDLLDQVDVVDDRPEVPGYDRDDFDWTDDHPGPGGNNGCDTRDDVLAAQLDDVARDPDDSCEVVSGTLDDPYTGETIPFDAAQPGLPLRVRRRVPHRHHAVRAVHRLRRRRGAPRHGQHLLIPALVRRYSGPGPTGA